MRGLYAIVDVATLAARGLEPAAFARAVLSAHPAALQVRAKDVPTREFLALLRTIAPLCREARVPLVANDRIDLAALAGCDYVHLGQEDLPLDLARRIAPGLRVGISTHTLEQLDCALAQRPDYVAFGPVYPTGSKANPDPCVGLEGLALAAARASAARIPLVAIGGITLERLPDVVAFADAAAVIADLLAPISSSPKALTLSDVAARAELLHTAFRCAGGEQAASA